MEEIIRTGIKYWAEDDRPREKLFKKGTGSISDSELLAILIREGSGNLTALDIAKQILAGAGNSLEQLGRWGVHDYMKFKGIGQAKAVALVAAMELGRRRDSSKAAEAPSLCDSKAAFTIMQPEVGHLPHEEFWILYLNNSNKLILKHKVSSGGITGTVVDVRLVMKKGLDLHACAIIACHNHPSGNTRPSGADGNITRSLAEAGKVMGIKLIDHIIIAGAKYYSFADSGEL
jgi:DNA repair protein RadC